MAEHKKPNTILGKLNPLRKKKLSNSSETGELSVIPRASIAEDTDVVSQSGIKCADPSVDFQSLLQWRAPDWLKNEYEYELCGMALDGSPILTIQLGKWDMRKLTNSEDKEEMIRYLDQMYARLDARMKKNAMKTGNVINQFISVVDNEGFGMKQLLSYHGYNNIKALVRNQETKYPNSTKINFMLNTSFVYKALNSAVKSLMSPGTVESQRVYGTNHNEWKEALLKIVPADQLPFRLGGTLVPPGTAVVDFKKLIYGRRYSIFAEARLDEDDSDGGEDDIGEHKDEGKTKATTAAGEKSGPT